MDNIGRFSANELHSKQSSDIVLYCIYFPRINMINYYSYDFIDLDRYNQ